MSPAASRYVVRDPRRALRRLAVAAAGSALVLVVVLQADFGWFGWAFLGLSLLGAARTAWRAAEVLRVDHGGISLEGRHSAWPDVAVVAAVADEVAVERRHGAPLPAWERSSVTEPGRGLAYQARVRGLDRSRLAEVLRQLPQAAHVAAHVH